MSGHTLHCWSSFLFVAIDITRRPPRGRVCVAPKTYPTVQIFELIFQNLAVLNRPNTRMLVSFMHLPRERPDNKWPIPYLAQLHPLIEQTTARYNSRRQFISRGSVKSENPHGSQGEICIP